MAQSHKGTPSSTHTPLFGRSDEFGQLEGLLDRAVGGALQVALVEGEPGIGKSRLLSEVIEAGQGRGLTILYGACEELERTRPFGAIVEALDLEVHSPDRERARIGELLRGDADAGVPPLPGGVDLGFQITEAIVALVERWVLEAPVLLAMEDLHWSDPSTLRTLRVVSRRLAHLPIALFGTLRPLPTAPELGSLVDGLTRDGATYLTLGALDQQAVTALTEELTAATAGVSLLRLVEGAGGNPLFVIELLRSLRDEGDLQISNERAEVTRTSLPASLRSTILRRLTFLPEETRRILRLASVLGSSFAVSDLATVTGQSTMELLVPLEAAVRAGLLTEHGDRLAFRHDLIRESIYEDVPGSVRKALHGDAGRALAAAGASPLQVAQHLSLGAVPGDTEAVKWLRKAGRQAAAHSTPIGVELLSRALELSDPSHPKTDSLSAELAFQMVQLGRLAEGEGLATSVLERSPNPLVENMLRVALANALIRKGRVSEAAGQFERAADVVPDPWRYMTLSAAAVTWLFVGEAERAQKQAEEVKGLGERDGNDFALCQAFEVLSWMAADEGRSNEAIELASKATQCVHRVDSSIAAVLTPEPFLGTAFLDADRPRDAEEAVKAGMRRIEQLGNVSWLPLYHAGLCETYFVVGRWDEALSEAEAGLALCDELEIKFTTGLYQFMIRIAIARDEIHTASELLAKAFKDIPVHSTNLFTKQLLWAQALLHEARGEEVEAIASMKDGWTLVPELRYFPNVRFMAADAVRLALRAGDVERARSIAAGLDGRADVARSSSIKGLALRCKGLTTRDPDTLLRSVTIYRDGPRVYERAQACEDAAVALAQAGRTQEARALLDEALTIYDELNAARDVSRMTALLREFGIRVGSRASRRRPTVGWDSLTPTEREVAKLVSEGLTNPEVAQRLFVSRYTVQTHLKHVFQKLDLRSRVELAAEVLRHSESPHLTVDRTQSSTI